MQRILVPLDGSELAGQAIPWADHLATALEADVELLYVIDHGLYAEAREAEIQFNRRLQRASSVAAPAAAIQITRVEREARQVLSRARSEFQHAKRVDLTVSRGYAPEAIVAHAHASQAALIVMGSHGRSGLARTLLGSVAGHVIRESGTPIFLLGPNLQVPPQAPTRVLVPLDMSSLAEAALGRVLPLARELRWKVVLFSAAALPPEVLPIQGAAIPLGAMPEHVPADLADYLEGIKEELRKTGLDAEIRVGEGHPAGAILGAADAAHVGLIVMSTHGRGGIGRWVLGSVTEGVIHAATVPVLAVRPPSIPLPLSAAFPRGAAADADESVSGERVLLTLTGAQARVTRLALDHLAWSGSRHDAALPDIRGALSALDDALDRAAVMAKPAEDSEP
jgi:nucleotide-binding universal stress UspA family protein